VPTGVRGTHAVVVGGSGSQSRIGVGGYVSVHGRERIEVSAIQRAFDGEADLVAGVVGPGQVDLAAGNRRGRERGWGGWGKGEGNGIGRVGRRRVTAAVVGLYAVVVNGGGGKTGIGERSHVFAYGRDLGEVDPVCRALNLET